MGEKGIELEKTQEPIQINTESYFKAITKVSFIKALRMAAAVVEDSGHEAQFEVSQNSGKKRFLISPVIEGEAAGTERHTPLLSQESEELWDYESQSVSGEVLVHVHYHPNNSLAPSLPDLEVIEISAALGDSLPMIGVATVDHRGNIDLLLVLKRFEYRPSKDFFEELDEEVRDLVFPDVGIETPNATKNQLIAVLNNSGLYRATILSLPRGQKNWPRSEIEKLKAFLGV
jgi:hypothetical protein